MALVFTAPFFDEEIHSSQRLLNLIGVGVWLINFIDGKDDGHVGSHSVVDGLFRLRHDVVIGSDDNDGDVRHLCTAGTHGCKCFVAWGVEEGDVASVFKGDVVGTDVLGDAASLASNYVSLADIVKE